jgi:hypothetical protein
VFFRSGLQLRIRLLLAVAALFATACAPTAAPPAARPVPVIEPVERDPMTPPWRVQRTGAPQTQTIDVVAELVSRVDTLRRVDSLQSELTVRWSSPSVSFPRRFLGGLQDYRVAVGVDSLATPPGLFLPIPFSAEQSDPSRQPVFTTPDAGRCDSPSYSLLHGVRDVWLSLPESLHPGQEWSDSAEYVVCRDSIPLRTAVDRLFRVTGALTRDSAVVVTIERRTTTTITGEGLQFGEPVRIEGAGEGALMLEVALDGARVVFGSGESELRLTLIGRRRTQELTQRSRIAIRER